MKLEQPIEEMMEQKLTDRELSSKGTCTEGLWDMHTHAEGPPEWTQAKQLAVEKPQRPFCSRSGLSLSRANSIPVDLVSV